MSGPDDPPRERQRGDVVYDVLVQECGAYDDVDARASFAHLFPGCVEYRFQGSLGFGGKVWSNHGRLYVTCYREDATPSRLAAIERANERLAAITGEVSGG